MTRVRRGLALVLGWAIVMSAGGTAQQARPLPDEDSLYAATRANLSKAQREQYRYAYKERRSELHVNPFGSRVGTGGMRVYEVTPGPSAGVIYRKLIERDGKVVTNGEQERVEGRTGRQPSTPRRGTIDDIIDALDFHVDRREMLDDREAVVVTFSPRPGAKPQTREGRIAHAFKGDIWIDEHLYQVMQVQAIAIDDLSFGYGLLARLNEGTRATLTQKPVEGGIWLPTSLRFVGEGRAMLFRKLTIDYVIDWFDYRKVK
jgi:hypothetical protein